MTRNVRTELGGETPFVPIPPHKTETLGGTDFSPVVPKGAKYMLVQSLAQNSRYTLDGTIPTAAIGFQLKSTDSPIVIELAETTFPRFFRESSGAVLQYCFGK